MNAPRGAASLLAMFKTQHSRTATSNYLDIHLPGGLVIDINRHHDDVSLSVALRNKGEDRMVRLTAYRSTTLTLGAALQIEDGGEEPLNIALYLGKLALLFSARGRYGRYDYPKPEGPADPETGNLPPPRTPPVEVEPPGLLRRVVRALTPKHGRRKLAATLDYFDTETPEGSELRARAVLWDDDYEHRVGNLRQPSLCLTHLLWGKPTQHKETVIEEREVVVGLPEGSYRMTARLMQKVVTWPRWPLRRLFRWIDFGPAAMLVPMKNSDAMQYEGHGPGCRVGVSGTTFPSAIGELVRRVTRARENYGGRNWLPRPTPHRRDSHSVSFSWEKPAKDQDSTAAGADLFHGDILGVGAAQGRVVVAPIAELAVPVLVATMSRDNVDGGVWFSRVDSPDDLEIVVDGERLAEAAVRLWPNSTVRIGGLQLRAHFEPVGPPAPLQQMEFDLPPGPEEQVASDVAEVAASLDTSPPSADEVVVPRPEDFELPVDEERPVTPSPEDYEVRAEPEVPPPAPAAETTEPWSGD